MKLVDAVCLQRNVDATVSLLTPEDSQLTSDSQEVGWFSVWFNVDFLFNVLI